MPFLVLAGGCAPGLRGPAKCLESKYQDQHSLESSRSRLSSSSRKGIQAEVLTQMEEQRLSKHGPFRKHLWEREDVPQSRHTGSKQQRPAGKGLCKEDFTSHKTPLPNQEAEGLLSLPLTPLTASHTGAL